MEALVPHAPLLVVLLLLLSSPSSSLPPLLASIIPFFPLSSFLPFTLPSFLPFLVIFLLHSFLQPITTGDEGSIARAPDSVELQGPPERPDQGRLEQESLPGRASARHQP